MSVTFFLHLNETENDAFDLEKFNREMEKKYPGTNKKISCSCRSWAIQRLFDHRFLGTNTDIHLHL